MPPRSDCRVSTWRVRESAPARAPSGSASQVARARINDDEALADDGAEASAKPDKRESGRFGAPKRCRWGSISKCWALDSFLAPEMSRLKFAPIAEVQAATRLEAAPPPMPFESRPPF